MIHNPFEPAPYKLIPLDPVSFFLAAASLAIAVSLLVLLGILLKSMNLSLAEQLKKLIRPEARVPEEDLYCSAQRFADDAYEMEIGEGSTGKICATTGGNTPPTTAANTIQPY